MYRVEFTGFSAHHFANTCSKQGAHTYRICNAYYACMQYSIEIIGCEEPIHDFNLLIALENEFPVHGFMFISFYSKWINISKIE